MLGAHNLVAFSATKDAARARTFYESTLGLHLVADEPYALVFDAHGTMLRVQKTQKFEPVPHTSLGWNVPDIAAAVTALAHKGVEFSRFDGLGQDEAGIWSSPSGAKVAWFKDPDGNLLSLTQF